MKTRLNLFKLTINIISTIMLALVGYIIVAHFLNPHELSTIILSTKEIYLSIAMGAMFLGVLVAFWKRKIGGLITILSYVVFALLQGTFASGFVFYMFIALGIANLVFGYYQRK